MRTAAASAIVAVASLSAFACVQIDNRRIRTALPFADVVAGYFVNRTLTAASA